MERLNKMGWLHGTNTHLFGKSLGDTLESSYKLINR